MLIYQGIQFLLNGLLKEEKLYLARILYREGFTPTIWCREGSCHMKDQKYNNEQCKDHDCSCNCHLS